MRTITADEFNAHFFEVLDEVRDGEKIAVTNGEHADVIGFFVPNAKKKTGERPLGILKGKAKAVFADDFAITEEEFFGA